VVLSLVPFLLATVLAAISLWTIDRILRQRQARLGGSPFPRQLTLVFLIALAMVLVVLTLPVSNEARGQLLSLLGLVFTVIITLSSSTFAANAMAGLMLRAVSTFRPGDFISVATQFGRVTEFGLFHTEIQTEDRHLTTIPNLFLISNPFTVVRKSGTIVSATISLGYDVPRVQIEELLVEAATAAELDEPFVQVLGRYCRRRDSTLSQLSATS
jgi:small-conductance mechanosensitive channel